MPFSPPRPCAAPGCPECTNDTRCPAHQRAVYAARDAHRGTPAERGYDRTWRTLRKQKLLANPFCELRTHCAHLSITQQVAREVDHILPIHERPDLRLAWTNLRSACKRCHSARTMRDQVRGKHATTQAPSTPGPVGGIDKSSNGNRLPAGLLNIHGREIGTGGSS